MFQNAQYIFCTVLKLVQLWLVVVDLSQAEMFFAAWFYQKCKFKTREDLLSGIMLGGSGYGDGVSNAGLTLVVSELSMTILIMQKSTSTLTLKSVPNT